MIKTRNSQILSYRFVTLASKFQKAIETGNNRD